MLRKVSGEKEWNHISIICCYVNNMSSLISLIDARGTSTRKQTITSAEDCREIFWEMRHIVDKMAQHPIYDEKHWI